MNDEVQKIHEELKQQSEDFELQKKEKMQKLIEKRANLIGNFVGNQPENDFRKIKKVTYHFSSNEIEDYILISVYDEKKPIAVSSNLLGIEHLDGFQKDLAERFFSFAFSNYMELLDIEHNTAFEINFE